MQILGKTCWNISGGTLMFRQFLKMLQGTLAKDQMKTTNTYKCFYSQFKSRGVEVH